MPEWIIVRDKKPEIPWWLSHWTTRVAKDKRERDIYLAFKIGEEVVEFQNAINAKDKDGALDELGDLYEIVVLWLHEDWDVFCYHYPVVQDGIDLYSFALSDIIDSAEQKRITHGWFDQGVLLDVCTVDT